MLRLALHGNTTKKRNYEDSPEHNPSDGEGGLDADKEAGKAYDEVPEYLHVEEGKPRGRFNYTLRRPGCKGSVQVQCVPYWFVG